MPRPPSPTPTLKRAYRVPAELAKWLDSQHNLYKMRDGRYANKKIDVVRDALETIRENRREYAIGMRELPATPLHTGRPSGKLVPINYKLPAPLVEWVQEYYRFHRMLDGTRAADYTDLVVDALERARLRANGKPARAGRRQK